MGVKEAEPPKRVRSNDFSSGAVSSNGRSRSSSKNSLGPAGLSSGKRQSSVSRVPTTGMSKGRPGGRSSSTGGKMSIGTTPLSKGTNRSSSGNRSSERLKVPSRTDFMTPQRVSTSKKSMASTERRMTSSALPKGTHQRLSGRGSQIGAKGSKDTRPLNDNAFRQSQIRKILDFLRNSGYSNTSLTSKNFPLATKEFVSVFNFLYSHIDPSVDKVLPYYKFEEDAPRLLKSLNYPTNLSKSNFISIGTMHSWPTVLGCLAYLCDLATLYTRKLYPDVVALSFPMKDENGFPTDRESDDKIQFEFNLKCWAEFNAGADEFPEQLQSLHENLMENNGVDIDRLKYLEQQKEGLELEFQRFEGREIKKVDLLQEKQVWISDINKLSNYLEEMKYHNQMKSERIKVMVNEMEDLLAQTEALNTIVMELKSNCEQRKVSHIEIEGNKALIGEKRNQIDVARNEVEEVEKEVWEKEIEVSRKRDVVDNLVKQVNSLALQEGIRSKSGENVCLQVHSFQGGREDENMVNNSTRVELGEMTKGSRMVTRNTERELQATMSATEQAKREVSNRKNEMSRIEEELSRLNKELTMYKEQVDVEEKNFNTELALIKEQLHQLKSKDRVNIEMLERELLSAEEKLSAVRMHREKYVKDGTEFLRKVADRTVSYIEECTGYRDSAARAVLEAARTRVEMVKNSGRELEEKVERALQEIKDAEL